MSKYKVGDKFYLVSPDKQAEIRAIDESHPDGGVNYLVWVTGGWGADYSGSITEKLLIADYTKIEPFFEVGKTYKIGEWLYEVLELRDSSTGQKFAIAEGIPPYTAIRQERDLVVLSEYDLSSAKPV